MIWIFLSEIKNGTVSFVCVYGPIRMNYRSWPPAKELIRVSILFSVASCSATQSTPIHTTSPGIETQVPTALRNLCWRKKINKWINLSNKWISIYDHSNNTDMSKGRLLFLSNFPLKTWLWKHCILCLQSYSRYFNSFESKANKLSTNKTNWIGLPSRSLSNPYVVRCP